MTVASIGAQIIERVYYLLTLLTCDLAPTNCRPETDTPNSFARHTDNECRLWQITDPGRLRLIEVTLETPRIGPFSAWTISASFDKVLRIRRGYPLEQYETINGVQYLVEDLKNHDAEQIDRQIVSGGLGNAIDTDHPAIPGVTLARLEGEVDEYGGRTRALLYGVQFERTY